MPHKPAIKESKFLSLRQGDLNRFYTKFSVGEVLAEQLGTIEPLSVIDLGSGDGTLSSSVSKIWPCASVVTVDADKECIPELYDNIAAMTPSKHSHYTHDVFDPNLPDVLAVHGLFDLAVCNPPFFKPEWRRDFARILQAANFEDACPSTSDASAELIFLAQNLRLVRHGGKIALISPDGMITGHRTKSVRQTVIDKFSIESVVQLPNHSFRDTEARCFIWVISKKNGENRTIKLLHYVVGEGISKPIYITPEQAVNRMDYQFHSARVAADEGVITLRQLGADIQRGSVSTVEARGASFPIFHTSDYSGSDAGLVSLGDNMPTINGKRLVVAEPGDILMARVDRRLHEKVGIVVSGKAALTDCVYRVRLPAKSREAAFRALRSPDGAAKLQAVSKGVSARLLGKADLLDMPIFI